uniref:Uncharacterized protein n=1 Tax=Aegilops tauschii TaxID=37682 RepID=M8C7D5_AEGTA
MQQSSPLLLLPLLLAAAAPLLTAAETIYCFGGVHKTNSTYGANLRRLAAVPPPRASRRPVPWATGLTGSLGLGEGGFSGISSLEGQARH